MSPAVRHERRATGGQLMQLTIIRTYVGSANGQEVEVGVAWLVFKAHAESWTGLNAAVLDSTQAHTRQ